MFDPIKASRKIKEDFSGYLTTRFQFADPGYAEKFKVELAREGVVAKGPFLDITDTFETGASIEDLIAEGAVSPLFEELERSREEKDKEIKLVRPLYAHQERAMREVSAGRNLVVTTGTGSGKTECFVLPILNHLLSEKEEGKLNPGVRAILIYPMNALANDQMKRLRSILEEYPDIKFGVFNGSTKETDEEGEVQYGQLFKDEQGRPMKSLDNELLSREAMRSTPPHILVTNYAMLEYMLLRPKDDQVFSGAQLRFLVLDEAHTYKGATGIETSLLMRRLKARISDPDNVIHILTSATLGGEDADGDILSFAKSLCNAEFEPSSIIRSKTTSAPLPAEPRDVPLSMFLELADPERPLNDILSDYNVDFDPAIPDDEILYDLCLSSRAYSLLRKHCSGPMSVPKLAEIMRSEIRISEEELIAVIQVASRAVKGKTPLIKARFHMFVRALEGVFTALSPSRPLLLTRASRVDEAGMSWPVFEMCVCDRCGRYGLVGRNSSNQLEQVLSIWDDHSVFVPADMNESWDDFDNGSADDVAAGIGEKDYLICASCGEIRHKSLRDAFSHTCASPALVEIREAPMTDAGNFRCPCCGQGEMNAFYVGYDAATAVLGTSLFEVLPERERVLESRPAEVLDPDDPFAVSEAPREAETVEKSRQYIAFSDSRSEAAYFASRMDSFYKQFLRRRGIWRVVEKNKESMQKAPWNIEDLVEELTAYFDTMGTFAKPGSGKGENLTPESRRQAWIAVLNEMVNSGSGTSLVSLGVINFAFKGNKPAVMESVARMYGQDAGDMTALFDRLAMTIVQGGAIESEECNLTDDEREYIYYTSAPQRFKLSVSTEEDIRNKALKSWLPRKRTNGSYYTNGRVGLVKKALELSEEDARKLLEQYWSVLSKHLVGNPGLYLTTKSFAVSVPSDERPLYKCDKCGKTTQLNCNNLCPVVKCDGRLVRADLDKMHRENHYTRLYSAESMSPMHVKEHTAQLGREEQQHYQRMFIDKELNILSCSTTFEMGVDVGDLEAVYLRNVPPSPANYVQRAGRAGRNVKTAAYALTYAKLSSHDLTFYDKPESMIGGEIGVPLFEVSNEKIIRRHMNAVALSNFFPLDDGRVYNGNDAHVLLNEDGFERFVEYLESRPESLLELMRSSIPEGLHEELGIDDWSWTEHLVGEDGSLRRAVEQHRCTVEWYKTEADKHYAERSRDASKWDSRLREIRRAPDDRYGRNELIEFLVRNNILPKYGFPVDTVELHQAGRVNDRKKLQLMRDLQLAVSEYAPGSQVVADGKLYTSRYIRKLPNVTGHDWEDVYIAPCPSLSCKTWNRLSTVPSDDGEECISCQRIIGKSLWQKAIEPRMGFIAEEKPKEVPMRNKPERAFGSDAFYIGDQNRKSITANAFDFGGSLVKIESSADDSLMVVCNDDFFVCEHCGYSESLSSKKEKGFSSFKKSDKKAHQAPWGKRCPSDTLVRRKLCHSFRTDVLRLTFGTPWAKSKGVMTSVLYALLEGASKQLDIEREDIKGCLHRVRYGGGMVFQIVLFDSVAGGAGHVRRLVDEDCAAFRSVVLRALSVTEGCTCQPSCYSCLRNYYNRGVHDILNRQKASEFLNLYKDECRPASIEAFDPQRRTHEHVEGDAPVFLEEESLKEFCDTWDSCIGMLEKETFFERIASRGVSVPDSIYGMVEPRPGDEPLEYLCLWASAKVVLFGEKEGLPSIEGWTVLSIDEVDADEIAQAINGVI